jgi:hypothetical protein
MFLIDKYKDYMASSTNFNPSSNSQINKPVTNEMKSYINLASSGHFPLFFNEWLSEGVNHGEPLSYRVANRNVREVFKNLSRHRTQEKKKTALTSLADNDRKLFVKSFIKVVEHNLLKDMKSLH